MNTIRFLLVAWWIATFIAALVLSGFRNPSFLQSLVVAGTLVLYVVSGAGLQLMHAKERRKGFELIVALLFPVLVYAGLFGVVDPRTARFWVFTGFLNLLVVVGGFLCGVLLSPLIARARSMSSEAVAEVVGFGARFVKAIRLGAFAVVLFSAAATGLAWAGMRLFKRVADESGRGLSLGVLLALGIFAVAWFVYRHTIFNLLQDSTLRESYKPEQAVEPPGK